MINFKSFPLQLRKSIYCSLHDVIKKYLKYAIDYDSYPANVKYCIQNMLREQQESEMGKRFLEAQTMEQICVVFDMKDYCRQVQKSIQLKELSIKRNNIANGNSEEPDTKRIKISDETTIEKSISFIRSNFLKDTDLPKSVLHSFTKKKLRTVPLYATEKQSDRTSYFRAVLTLGNKKYSSTFWEKNKKNAEQAAAMVCLLDMGLLKKEELIENGSMKFEI